jgi:hypothetical protein
MAERTLQDVFDIARELLKDEDSEEYRYTDVSLLRAFNTAITMVVDKRPDAMTVLRSGVPTYTSDDLASPFPLPITFFNPVVFFVVGYAELRNDEFTDDSRAATFMGRFERDLVGDRSGTR